MFTATTNTLLTDSIGNLVTLHSLSGAINLSSNGIGSGCTTGSPGFCNNWLTNASSDNDCAPGSGYSCQTDSIENQLLTNTPTGSSANAYPTNSSLAKPFKWKGPYLDLSSGSDPWGNAYLVNIIHCKSGSTNACFVLDAGANGVIETAHDNSRNATLTPGGDDIIYRIK